MSATQQMGVAWTACKGANAVREIVTRITEITGSIASLHANGIGLGELAEIQSPGRTTLGQVIRVSGRPYPCRDHGPVPRP